jgi:hypothetical protein
MTQALVARGYLNGAADKRFDVTVAGADWFARLGLDTASIKPGRGGIARQCLDWTEREHHVAGPLGTRLLGLLCEQGWLIRSKASRAVQVTPKGAALLREMLGIDATSVMRASISDDGGCAPIAADRACAS